VLFAGVFALRLAVSGPEFAVTLLFFIPVVIIAIEFGLIAGLCAGATAVILTQTALLITGDPVPLASYVSRTVAYLTVGAITGTMGARLRTSALALREGARHFELSGDLLCSADFKGNLVHLNDAWERVLGWQRDELMGDALMKLVHPDDLERTLAEVELASRGDRTARFQNRYRTKHGDYRWLEWSSRADQDARLIYAVARDVTDRHDAERQRAEAQERFHRIFNDSSAGIALVDLEGRIVEANQTLAEFLGYDAAELVGRFSLAEFAEPDSVPRVAEGVTAVLGGQQDLYRDQLQVKRHDGEMIWVDLTMSVIRDADGNPMYRMSQLLDIQAEKEAEAKLRHLADHDPLSGVFNRRRFEAELAEEMDHHAQHARSSAVLLFDVDDFKAINDTLGHAAGDAVIVRLGDSLKRHVRTGDVVARLGGDEFAVLLRRIGLLDAAAIADKLRDYARVELAQTIDAGSPLALSVGIAMIDGAADETGDEVLGRADAAMYEAKRRGGDQVAPRVALAHEGSSAFD
jgi:diguanylate cyclase (GGDEF)-like protein/PAS domain S-box-containing protein